MEEISGTVASMSQPFNRGWRFGDVQGVGRVVGVMPDLVPGDRCTFFGNWKDHPRYGKQFAVDSFTLDSPKDREGVRHYLSRHFKGIGPTIARRLVDTFEERLLSVIAENPDELTSVRGVSPEIAMDLHGQYLSIQGDLELDRFFATHGITPAMVERLVLTFGTKEKACRAIRKDPYHLEDLVWGVGFKRADAIALSLGLPVDSPERLRAGVRFTLKSASQGMGHCYLPEEDLLKQTRKVLGGGDPERIRMSLEDLVRGGEIVRTPSDMLYLAKLYSAEVAVATQVQHLMGAENCPPIPQPIPQAITVNLGEEQTQALLMTTTTPVSIITGGPGVGKTHTLDRIAEVLEGADIRIALAAPTGKAAKRMSEATGRPAKTIHRLLEYSPQVQGFTRGPNNPLEEQCIIVDEVSMVDLELMASLLLAIPRDTRVVFVGDVDQLPSVGPGRVFGDMIDSGRIPTTRLTKIYRQQGDSSIPLAARAINRGECPDLGESDFLFLEEDSASAIPGKIVNEIKRLSGKKNIPLHALQVLCPQKKTEIGAHELNRVLQPILNPGGQKIEGTNFLTGDRVIQLRNNYDIRVYNGEIGELLDSYVDEEDQKKYLQVRFDDKDVSYPFAYLDELALAYALTVHKSQGSEFPVVLIPLHTQNFMLLKRNILYTAVTRGRNAVVLVGSKKALRTALRSVDNAQRNTGLKDLIRTCP